MSKIVRNIPDGLEASYADIKLDTISYLANLTGTPPDIVWVSGYHTKGDGSYGSHIFEWDPNSTKAHNGGTIIELGAPFPTDWSDQTQLDAWYNYSGGSTGRYKLRHDGVVNVKWWGVNALSDFSTILIYIIENFSSIKINTEVKASVSAVTNNTKIYGGGTIFFDTQVSQILKINGDSNTIENITLIDKTPTTDMTLKTHSLLSVIGDKNKIFKCTLSSISKPISTDIADSYGRFGIYIEGDDNIVSSNEVSYTGNCLYTKDGFRNKIKNNFLHDGFVGIQLSNGECDTIIFNNHIKDCNIIDSTLPVEKHSGADGILAGTGSRRINISGNRIENCSEHGMYIQSIYSDIIGNIVSNNGGSGIKLAGKTGHFINWNGESPVLKGTGDIYVGYSNVIANNITFNNGSTINSTAGIYLQGGLVDIVVSGNRIYEPNCSGIKSAFEAANPDLRGIKIAGNIIEASSSSGNFGIAANSLIDSNISDNAVYGNFIFGGDSIQKSKNIEVTNNTFTGNISANNSDRCKIEGNRFGSFDKSNGLSISMINNMIENQVSDIDFNGIVELKYNKVTFYSNFKCLLAGSTCKEIIGNELISSYDTPDNSEIFFDYGYNSSSPVNTTIQNNIFNAPDWNRIARLGGSNNMIIGNTVSNNSAEADAICFDVQGTQSDTLYSNNFFTNPLAGLTIRSGANNILVNNHMGLFIDNGTGTKVGLIK